MEFRNVEKEAYGVSNAGFEEVLVMVKEVLPLPKYPFEPQPPAVVLAPPKKPGKKEEECVALEFPSVLGSEMVENNVALEHGFPSVVVANTSHCGSDAGSKLESTGDLLARAAEPEEKCSKRCYRFCLFQVLFFGLVFVLFYIPMRYNFISKMENRVPTADLGGMLELNNIDQMLTENPAALAQEVNNALQFDKTAAQDALEWARDNSPGIPIEHLDHHEVGVSHDVEEFEQMD